MFQKIQEKKQKRAELVAEMRSVHGLITTEKRDLSAAEVEQIGKIETDISTLDNELRSLETQYNLQKRFAQDNAIPIIGEGGKPVDLRSTQEYRTAFFNMVCGRDYDSRALISNDPAKGGTLIPVDFQAQLIAEIRNNSVLRGLCTIITTSSTTDIPTVTGHTVAAWGAEAAQYNETDAKFGKMTLSAYQLTALVKVSKILLNDSAIDIAAFLATDLGQAFAIAEEAALLSVARVDATLSPDTLMTKFVEVISGTAAAATFDDVIELQHAVKVPYRTQAQFLTSDAAVKNLRKLKDTTGKYIWSDSTQVGVPNMLFGKAVNISDQITFATGKPALVYGDFKQIKIADRGAMSMQRLNELYAASGQVGFIADRRMDAILTVPGAMAKLTLK